MAYAQVCILCNMHGSTAHQAQGLAQTGVRSQEQLEK